jgi:hypothetical protein
MRAIISLLFAAAQLQVHEFSATMERFSIRFTVTNGTYIPDGRV